MASTASAAPPASVDFPDVLRLESLRAFGDLELHLLPFLKTAITGTRDGTQVSQLRGGCGAGQGVVMQ